MPQYALQDFAKKPATNVISLGWRCATTYNVRRFFDFTSGFPFDWWISSEDGIARILQGVGPDFIYSSEQLYLADDCMTVRHRSLDIGLPHEFPRLNGDPLRPVVDNFKDFISRPQKRTAYLLNKLYGLDMASEHLLFVREADGDSGDRLERAISKRIQKASWSLAAVPRVAIDNDDEFGWRGKSEVWDRCLAKIGVSLDRRPRKVFCEPEPWKFGSSNIW